LGYLFQADPQPEWSLVDHNWHELGAMKYKMKIDTAFAGHYAREVKAMGHYVREVNYRGFPIDTGTVVAQALLNPSNRLPAAMVSCNMYAEKQESLSIGQAAIRALEKAGKKAIVVCVSGLSNRFEVKDIEPREDKISSLKDDEWNRKVLEIFGEGRLEDVSEVMREFSRQANADMGGRGIWWLNGLCGKQNDFDGKVFDYQPIWGTGAGIAGESLAMTPPCGRIANPCLRHILPKDKATPARAGHATQQPCRAPGTRQPMLNASDLTAFSK
jgi:2-aminophenol/2-amino-5-chlorophenol 1,6-dioxygenase alpha subunit